MARFSMTRARVSGGGSVVCARRRSASHFALLHPDLRHQSRHGTFLKFYDQAELKAYLEAQFQTEAVPGDRRRPAPRDDRGLVAAHDIDASCSSRRRRSSELLQASAPLLPLIGVQGNDDAV